MANKKYVYYFLADEPGVVEVDPQMYELLIEFDRKESNNNQTERYRYDEKLQQSRHVSFEAYDPEEKYLSTGVYECEEYLMGQEEEDYSSVLRAVVQEVVAELSENEVELYTAIYVKQKKGKDYAAERGSSPAAVSKRVAKLKKKVEAKLAKRGITGWEPPKGED